MQPIAYDVARNDLSQLKGPVRPRGFQGGLPFAYHVGGTNDVKLRLKTDMDYKLRTIWDVVARIDGTQEKDRWVVLGNHRDAWVFGAVDPNSGSSAMLEVGRGFGELLKQGWKPRRTIILCSWDAEEYGLIGSTEWAEEFANDLREKAVAYLNLDAAVSGANFGASSVPSLWKLIRAVTRDIKDPKTGKSVYQQWQDRTRESARRRQDTEKRASERSVRDRITRRFCNTLACRRLTWASTAITASIIRLTILFTGWTTSAIRIFSYHVAAAQFWGTLAMRLADADGLSLDYTDYASQVREYFNEVMQAGAYSRSRRNAG